MDVNTEQRPRRIRHLGVNALARELGVSPAHVSMVLSGKRESKRVSEAARKSRLIVAITPQNATTTPTGE